MSFYSPTFLYPDNIGITASTPNNFTWQINGTDIQTHYQLKIYKNVDNTLTYDSTKITSSTPLHTLPNATLTNGIDYKWQVIVYNNANIVYSDYIFFQARSLPTITFNPPSSITQQSYNFSATYYQAEGIKLKSYEFLLYDNASTPVLILDSGIQYLSATPNQVYNYTINGLSNGTTYNIKTRITTQNEMITETSFVTFSVSYTYPDTVSEFIATSLNDIGAIQLDWANLKQILGTLNGSYSYVTGKFNKAIYLNSEATLLFSETTTEDFTMTFWCKLPNGYSGEFLKLGSDFKIGYNGTKFYYENQYRLTAGNQVILPNDYFLIGVKHSQIIIVTNTYTEILK